MEQQMRNKKVYRVTLAGSAVNLLLVALKLVAGIVGSSAALVADAVHSLTDLLTDAVVIMFVKLKMVQLMAIQLMTKLQLLL